MFESGPTAERLSKRLCEIAWACFDKDYAPLKNIILAQGGTWDDNGPDQVCHSKYGVSTVGFPAGDPVTTFVQVCFALYGQMWPEMPFCGEAQQQLNKQWKRRSEAAKSGRQIWRMD